MRNSKLAIFTPEEEKQWLRKELLQEMKPNFFGGSNIWFRFTKYELKIINDEMYICPAKDSKFEKYKPFDEYPEILIDFMELIISLNGVPETEHTKCIDDILKFVNKYGLFGLFSHNIQLSLPIMDKNFNTTYKVFPRYTAASIMDLLLGRWNGEALDYDLYAERFFPELKAPLPKMDKDLELFARNYSEPYFEIFDNWKLEAIRNHLKYWLEFIRNGKKVTDIYFSLDKSHNVYWGQLIELGLDNLAVRISYNEQGKSELNWSFNSLIEALSLIYILNLSGKMGSEVEVCHLEGCNKAFEKNKNNTKYCCKKHGDRDRKRRERKRQNE